MGGVVFGWLFSGGLSCKTVRTKAVFRYLGEGKGGGSGFMSPLFEAFPPSPHPGRPVLPPSRRIVSTLRKLRIKDMICGLARSGFALVWEVQEGHFLLPSMFYSGV